MSYLNDGVTATGERERKEKRRRKGLKFQTAQLLAACVRGDSASPKYEKKKSQVGTSPKFRTVIIYQENMHTWCISEK